ncbi:hypothetical protein ACVOMV_25785 [Mesorhizobium atlanticum]
MPWTTATGSSSLSAEMSIWAKFVSRKGRADLVPDFSSNRWALPCRQARPPEHCDGARGAQAARQYMFCSP